LNYSEVNIDSGTRVLVEVTTPPAAQTLQRLLLQSSPTRNPSLLNLFTL